MADSVNERGFAFIKQAHPNARIEVRDGAEVVVIPTYDIESDVAGEVVKKFIRGGEDPKFQPGDFFNPKTGTSFSIVDPFQIFRRKPQPPKSDE